MQILEELKRLEKGGTLITGDDTATTYKELDELEKMCGCSKQVRKAGPPRPGLVPQSGDPNKPGRWVKPRDEPREERPRGGGPGEGAEGAPGWVLPQDADPSGGTSGRAYSGPSGRPYSGPGNEAARQRDSIQSQVFHDPQSLVDSMKQNGFRQDSNAGPGVWKRDSDGAILIASGSSNEIRIKSGVGDRRPDPGAEGEQAARRENHERGQRSIGDEEDFEQDSRWLASVMPNLHPKVAQRARAILQGWGSEAPGSTGSRESSRQFKQLMERILDEPEGTEFPLRNMVKSLEKLMKRGT